MNALIRSKKRFSVLLIAFLIVCPDFSPKAQVISPPLATSHPSLNKPEDHGVAAIALNDVWAVGGYGIQGNQAWQLIEHWDGKNWTFATTPTLNTPNELQAVSAVAASDVWAVGGYNSAPLDRKSKSLLTFECLHSLGGSAIIWIYDSQKLLEAWRFRALFHAPKWAMHQETHGVSQKKPITDFSFELTNPL